MKKFIYIFWALFSAIAAAQTPAAQLPKKTIAPAIDTDTRLVLRAVGERYKKLQKWEAKFSQETFSIGLGKGTYNEGRFVFEAPNKFRYSVIRPEASDYLSDGKKAWYISFREGRDKPAYVRVADDLRHVELDRYLIVLRGIDVSTPAKEKQLLKEFRPVGKIGPTELRLELTPVNSEEISKITLVFKNKEAALSQAIITDALGNPTTITLSVYQPLTKVDPKEFKPEFVKGSQIEKF